MQQTNTAFIKTLDDRYLATSKTAQFVADAVARSRYYNQQNLPSNSFTLLIDKELGAALTAGPPASAESQQQAIENLRLSLSKSEADKAALDAKLAQSQLQAENLRGQVQATNDNAEKARQEANKATVQVTQKIELLTGAEAQIKIKAAEADEARKTAQQEAAAHTRLKVAAICMSIGVAIIVLAVVATFLHVPGVLAGGGFTGAIVFALGWAITYVEDLLQHVWFQYVIGFSILGSIVAVVWMGIRALKARQKAALDAKGLTATIGALQEAKNDDARSGTTKFAAVKPHLAEWMVDDKGKPDLQLQAHIDQQLVQMNLKNPGDTQPVPVSTVTVIPALSNTVLPQVPDTNKP